MTFDTVSYVAGLLTFPAVVFVTYHISRIITLRAKEHQEWEQIRSQSSPSEDYWKTRTEPQRYGAEESITISPPSPTRRVP